MSRGRRVPARATDAGALEADRCVLEPGTGRLSWAADRSAVVQRLRRAIDGALWHHPRLRADAWQPDGRLSPRHRYERALIVRPAALVRSVCMPPRHMAAPAGHKAAAIAAKMRGSAAA